MTENKTKILLGFDLFGFDNSTLQHSLERFGEDTIVFSNDENLDNLLNGDVKIVSVPRFDGDIVSKYFTHAVNELNYAGVIVIGMPHFPFLKKEQVDECISLFVQTDPSFLITMVNSGLDSEALYISHSRHIKKSNGFLSDEPNSFVYMLDNVAGYKALNPEMFREALEKGIERVKYSTEKQKELAAKYQDNMKDYDREFMENPEITDPVVLRSARDAPERIVKIASMPKGKRVLDIGCSSGNVLIRYARKAPKDSYILGVDIDEDLIKKAKEYLEKEPDDVKKILQFVNKPVEDIDEPAESFDTLSATEFFEHILQSEHYSIMSHCLRFLKPEGNMIVGVPNRFPNNIYAVQKRYRWDWFNHYTHFTKKSLEAFMGKYFKEVVFHTVYDEQPCEGIFLIAEGKGKK